MARTKAAEKMVENAQPVARYSPHEQRVAPPIPFKGVSFDDLMNIEREVTAEREASRARPEGEAPKPPGYFADLGDDTACANLECLRPFLADGKTVYAFTDGALRGRVCCVECACQLHPAIALAWAQKRGQIKADDATVARMTIGQVTDRNGRRGDNAAARAEVNRHGDEQTRQEMGEHRMALPRM